MQIPMQTVEDVKGPTTQTFGGYPKMEKQQEGLVHFALTGMNFLKAPIKAINKP